MLVSSTIKKLAQIANKERNLRTSMSNSEFGCTANFEQVPGLVRSNSKRVKTAASKNSNKKESYSCRQVQIMSMDATLTPNFVLSSNKSQANLTALPNTTPGNWNVVGSNCQYLSYKELYANIYNCVVQEKSNC